MIAAKQFSKYGGVAAGSAITDYAVFSAFLFLGAGILPAQMIARIAGGIFSFVLNKYWSFDTRSRKTLVIEGRRFLVLYAFSYVLALGILYTLTEHMDLGAYPAKIIADTSCFMVNFVFMRRYVFGGGRGLRGRARALTKSP
jgi:putative flippase GtrA